MLYAQVQKLQNQTNIIEIVEQMQTSSGSFVKRDKLIAIISTRIGMSERKIKEHLKTLITAGRLFEHEGEIYSAINTE